VLIVIAAMSENRVIGRGGRLPWHLPADLRRFKALTTGHPVVMGRRTWETLSGPLPGRTTIVLTRDRACAAGGAIVVHDLDAAIARAAGAPGGAEVFVAGGAEVYRESIPRADRMELTIVHAVVEGDAFFPEWDESAWTIAHDERHERDERHAHAFSFRTYVRSRPRATPGSPRAR
jgi:dihydrofolate reductase